HHLAMPQQVLYLDRDVVCNAGKFAREPADDRVGVTNAVEEVGIPEGHVPRSGGNLRANVREDDLVRDHTEASLVDRNDRAMPASVLAPAARFRVSGRSPFAVAL